MMIHHPKCPVFGHVMTSSKVVRFMRNNMKSLILVDCGWLVTDRPTAAGLAVTFVLFLSLPK